MTNQPSTTGANASAANTTQAERDNRKILLKHIGGKSNKFSKQELDGLKDALRTILPSLSRRLM
jgi:hypothetical protein